MNKIALSLVSLVGMAGFAVAQGTQTKPGAVPATGAKPGAGSAAPTAQPGGPTATPAQPPAKMEMPKPPPEIKEMAKTMAGTWRCTGTGVGPDLKTELKFTGTQRSKVDLDGWWIKSSMTGTMGTGKTAMKLKMEGYLTYDPSAKTWRGVGVMNDGMMMVSTSDGLKEGKMTSTSDTYGPMGQGMFRDTMDLTDKKAGAKGMGEMSMDKGKTWTKVYEMTCKK